MIFQLPSGQPEPPGADLDRACLAGGYDNMPAPTQVVRGPGELRLIRDVDESGYLVVPWDVAGVGRLMGSSATLMERPDPLPTRRRTGPRQGEPAPRPGVRLAGRRPAHPRRPGRADPHGRPDLRPGRHQRRRRRRPTPMASPLWKWPTRRRPTWSAPTPTRCSTPATSASPGSTRCSACRLNGPVPPAAADAVSAAVQRRVACR